MYSCETLKRKSLEDEDPLDNSLLYTLPDEDHLIPKPEISLTMLYGVGRIHASSLLIPFHFNSPLTPRKDEAIHEWTQLTEK